MLQTVWPQGKDTRWFSGRRISARPFGFRHELRLADCAGDKNSEAFFQKQTVEVPAHGNVAGRCRDLALTLH